MRETVKISDYIDDTVTYKIKPKPIKIKNNISMIKYIELYFENNSSYCLNDSLIKEL